MNMLPSFQSIEDVDKFCICSNIVSSLFILAPISSTFFTFSNHCVKKLCSVFSFIFGEYRNLRGNALKSTYPSGIL